MEYAVYGRVLHLKYNTQQKRTYIMLFAFFYTNNSFRKEVSPVWEGVGHHHHHHQAIQLKHQLHFFSSSFQTDWRDSHYLRVITADRRWCFCWSINSSAIAVIYTTESAQIAASQTTPGEKTLCCSLFCISEDIFCGKKGLNVDPYLPTKSIVCKSKHSIRFLLRKTLFLLSKRHESIHYLVI